VQSVHLSAIIVHETKLEAFCGFNIKLTPEFTLDLDPKFRAEQQVIGTHGLKVIHTST